MSPSPEARPPLSPEEQFARLTAGAVDVVRGEELLAKLKEGRPLVVKLGFDPSAPDLHLGHYVVLRKLREFQALGHEVVFVVGDFTARIGDPSGRSRTRPALTREEVELNARTYRDQVSLVLDPSRTRLAHNSVWLEELGASGWIRLSSHSTVARMLERDDFSKRYHAGQPISIHEFLYPLAQAYDSVAIGADVEIGGTDQTFNLLLGRDLQREHGQPPQVVLTMPLLVGLDGTEKMSKSLGNFVALTEPPDQMYGKLMSVSDDLMWSYYSLLSEEGPDFVAGLRQAVADGSSHPMKLKQDLARGTVETFHGTDAANAAESAFLRVFRDRQAPSAVEQIPVPAQAEPIGLAKLLASTGLAASAAEARRLLQSGAVRIDGDRVPETQMALNAEPGRVYDIQVGKRRFARLLFQ